MTTLKEYKEMMEGATPAPWGVHKQNQKSYVGNNLIIIPEHINMVVCTIWAGHEDDETASNGKFIAASRNIAPNLIRVIELAERKLKNIAVYDLYDCSSVEDTDFQAQCKNMYEYAIDILNEIKLLKGE